MKYKLDSLGSDEFEALSQALVQKIIGLGAKIYGAGKDGGREATFEGKAPYPSTQEQWSGKWIFQAKFHDVQQIGPREARRLILRDLESELRKITDEYALPCDNYIMITNVPLTPVRQVGLRDRIDAEIIPLFSKKIKNIHVWGGDDVCRFLDNFTDIRTAYAQFLTPGDIVAVLIDLIQEKQNDLLDMVKLYVTTCYLREQYATLRDAGDVDDDEIPLKEVFIDLDVAIPTPMIEDDSSKHPSWLKESILDSSRISALSYLLDDSILNLVLIGGPGEGKSTLGQFLSQIYRSRLIEKLPDFGADGSSFENCLPRIPFRVILRDYGQWISNQTDTSLYHYLAKDFTEKAGKDFTSAEVHKIVKSNPIILILDGLDEVPDKKLRTQILGNINEFITQIRDVYKGDIRVIATTRPYGYSQEFSPQNFLHLTINPMSKSKTMEYVDKWISQRENNPCEASRIKEVFNTCLESEVISVLTQTPLQVTILLFILKTKGIPPKQREELFEEYMKIIYQREQKNRPELLRTEYTTIYGLHQYIAYILHRNAATDNTGALMDMSEFRTRTIEYVHHSKQLEEKADLDKMVEQIMDEARQRLVLIESPQENKIGFRLTSIREFFTASHLVDTSLNTIERDSRFQAIATDPHWRNVALFFAGRVGRNNPASIASLIDACRNIDTSYPDKYLKRGAELVLKMIEEKAIREDYNQVGAIQYGLTAIGMFSRYLDDYEYLEYRTEEENIMIDTLKNLPQKFKERIVKVVLKEQMENTPVEECVFIHDSYHFLFGYDDNLKSFFKRCVESDNNEIKTWVLFKILNYKISDSWAIELIEKFAKLPINYTINNYSFINSKSLLNHLTDNAKYFIMTLGLRGNPRPHNSKNLNDFDTSKIPIDLKDPIDRVFYGTLKIIETDQKAYEKQWETRSRDNLFFTIPGILYPNLRENLVKNYHMVKESLNALNPFYDRLDVLKTTMEFFFENMNEQAFLEKYNHDLDAGKFPYQDHTIFGMQRHSNILQYITSLRNLINKPKDVDHSRILEQTYEILNQNSKTISKHPIKMGMWILSNYDQHLENYLDSEIISKFNSIVNDQDLRNIFPFISYLISIDVDEEILKMQIDFLKKSDKKMLFFSNVPKKILTTLQSSEIRIMLNDILNMIMENPKSYSIYELKRFYIVALKSNILTEESMKFFASILTEPLEYIYIPPGLSDDTIKFLKTMLKNSDSHVKLLSLWSLTGVNTIMDDAEMVDSIFNIAKTLPDKILRRMLRVLRHFKLDWKNNGTAYLGLLSSTKNQLQEEGWANIIQSKIVGQEELDSFLQCVYTILESNVYSRFMRTIAYSTLSSVINENSHIDFDEKKLHLPLRNPAIPQP